jgi:hypothetical protein
MPYRIRRQLINTVVDHENPAMVTRRVMACAHRLMPIAMLGEHADARPPTIGLTPAEAAALRAQQAV